MAFPNGDHVHVWMVCIYFHTYITMLVGKWRLLQKHRCFDCLRCLESRVQLWCISCRSCKCGRSRLAPRDSWDSHTRTTDVPPRILSEMSECRFNFAHLNYNYKHGALLAGKFKLSPGIQWINSVLRETATLYSTKLGPPMQWVLFIV